MARRKETISVRVELDRQTDSDFTRWARSEARSKRRFISVLVGRLVRLQKTEPERLMALGLMDRTAEGASNGH